jgi:DNA-binding transcriptional LysR family regulator
VPAPRHDPPPQPDRVGRAYFDRSRDIIHQLTEAEEAASALQSTPRGRCASTDFFGIRHLTPALPHSRRIPTHAI